MRWLNVAAVAALPLVVSSCVSAAVHESAIVARETSGILRAASVPDPRYSDAEKAAWERLWAKQDAALRAIVEETR